jgi:hypothetical protein
MEHCQKLEEAVPHLRALVGHLVYKDGSFMPAIFFDVSQDSYLENRIAGLQRSHRLAHFKLRFDDGGTVLLESVRELLDGRRLEDLVLRFTPDAPEDIDAFMGLMEITHSWVLIVRLGRVELHIVISPDDDSVMFSYTSQHVSTVKKFKVS